MFQGNIKGGSLLALSIFNSYIFLQDFQAQKTCLVIAAEQKDWDLVKALVSTMKVDVNIKTRTDQRAINHAIRSSRADIINLLFEHDTECHNWKDIAPSEEVRTFFSYSQD